MEREDLAPVTTAALPPITWEDVKEQRAPYLRGVLEALRAMQCTGDSEALTAYEVRSIAKQAGVPYLFLLLELYLDRTYPELTLEDIAEWQGDAEAQRVFAGWVSQQQEADGDEQTADEQAVA